MRHVIHIGVNPINGYAFLFNTHVILVTLKRVFLKR